MTGRDRTRRNAGASQLNKTVGMERAVDDLEPRGEPRPAPASAAPIGEPTPASNRRRRWLLAVLLVLLVLGGTTVAILSPRPRDTATPAVPADTDAPFPSDTASDVVSYADHVALVTASPSPRRRRRAGHLARSHPVRRRCTGR